MHGKTYAVKVNTRKSICTKNNLLKGIRVDDAIGDARHLTKPKLTILLAANDDTTIISYVDCRIINKECGLGNGYLSKSLPNAATIFTHLLLHDHKFTIPSIGLSFLGAMIALAKP